MSETSDLFRRLTLGVYVVGVADGVRRDAFTAAWIVQASFNPLLLAVSVNPHNASYELFHGAGGFAVSVLKRGQLELAKRFGTRSGREQDKLAGIRWHAGRRGSPILDDALAYFDCELAGRMQAGDHELILGRVVDGSLLDPGAPPLTYAETGDLDRSAELYPDNF